MKHNEPETMCSLEWLKHERRKAWQEGYAAGWKDQECDFPPHTSENPYKEYQKMSDNVNHPKHYECPAGHLTTGDTPYPREALDIWLLAVGKVLKVDDVICDYFAKQQKKEAG